jgi:hypothetical protein
VRGGKVWNKRDCGVLRVWSLSWNDCGLWCGDVWWELE